MAKQTTYNVGIYVRLSQEDERAGESLSIENQKKMLTEYVIYNVHDDRCQGKYQKENIQYVSYFVRIHFLI